MRVCFLYASAGHFHFIFHTLLSWLSKLRVKKLFSMEAADQINEDTMM